jgi:hypothetical protein
MRRRTRSYPYIARIGRMTYIYRTLRDCRYKIKTEQGNSPCAIYDLRRLDASGRPRIVEYSHNGETWRRTA